MATIEEGLDLGELAIATTPGMRATGVTRESSSNALTRVRQARTAMLVALAIIDVAGIVVALT